MDAYLSDFPVFEETWLPSDGNVFDLSAIKFETTNNESSMGEHFVEDLLNEITTRECDPLPNAPDSPSSTQCLENTALQDSDSASIASFDTGSSASIDSCSLASDDKGFVSLDRCSASLSDFLDPEDFNALLDTLTASLPKDMFSTPDVLGGACYNLSQCSSNGSHTSMDSKTPTEPMTKPDISYIELVAKAIMDSPNNSVLLADIYQWIENNYPYYKYTKNSWRNSIRHNLSVNECFVKSKRVKNGRGFYWSIHSSCMDAFKRGDFDRQKARRQVQECNRAFSCAFEELQGLTRTTRHPGIHQPGSTPHYDQQFQVGARTYLAPCSTPVRGQTNTYPAYYCPY